MGGPREDAAHILGRVEFGEDLMVIEIGDEVVVHGRGANTPR